MILAQEAEIKLRKYEGLNDDDPSVLQVSAICHSEVLAEQGQSIYLVFSLKQNNIFCW